MKYQSKNITPTAEERILEADSSGSLLNEMISGILFGALLIGLIIYFLNQ